MRPTQDSDAQNLERTVRPWTRPDSIIAGGFLLYAMLLLGGLWSDLDRGYLSSSGSDQNLWEWFFAVTARSVAHLQNPLASDLQNHPLGVNMMANTAIFGLSVPLTPVTLTLGPTVTWAVILTGSLAGTATAWYWVYSRHLVRHRGAAAVGGGFSGFAPPMISHANAHPNFVAWFVVPFLALTLVKLARGDRPVRHGVVLGLLTAFQILLGEEVLLIAAVALTIVAVVVLVDQRGKVRELARPLGVGLGTGAAVTIVLVSVPLWWQFFGPQSYHGIAHGSVGNDTAALVRFSTQSLAGVPSGAAEVSVNRTEENAFFGWPLIVLVVVLAVWLWRDLVARSMAVAAVAMALLSLGATIVVARVDTGIPGPWALLDGLPLFDAALVSRFAMACVPLVGVLLAIATDRVLEAPDLIVGPDERRVPLRLLWIGMLVAVLLPLAPTQLPVLERPTTPAFLADGTWRGYVDPGGTVVPVPLSSSGESEPLHWQVVAGLSYPMPGGYFVGPQAPDDRRGRYGAPDRPTSALFDDVLRHHATPVFVDLPRAREQALEDLRYWNADVLVLAPRRTGQEAAADVRALRGAVEQLLARRGQFVDGVTLWDVRDLTR